MTSQELGSGFEILTEEFLFLTFYAGKFSKSNMGNRDEIGFSGVSNFLTTYISNLSKTDDGHDKAMTELNEIKTKIENTEIDNGLFYINILIDDCQNSYINSKSKPLSFNDALIKVEEILS
jgi:hypothetical protein